MLSVRGFAIFLTALVGYGIALGFLAMVPLFLAYEMAVASNGGGTRNAAEMLLSLPLCLPSASKGGDTAIGAVETKRHQVSMQLLDRSLLLARLPRFLSQRHRQVNEFGAGKRLNADHVDFP